jgi:beta-glucosidase/6-phospho-beta-glucosidase/beta-galactosidase
LGPDKFVWAAGIEDTFITYPWPRTNRTLDEYELTQHYERWNKDIGLFAELGLRCVRYGIPWHRVNPAPGKWDWDFPDKTFDLLLNLGIQPIVDLVHYGLPPWIENAYLHPEFAEIMAEYGGRIAERYRGRIHCYTPLNEPRVTAWYCGKLGWWPPGLRGWRGFLSVLHGVCRGIVQSVSRFKEIDPEILPVMVDATDLYETEDETLHEEVSRRQEIVFLPLDLISGRVTQRHSLYCWLVKNGITDEQLGWFVENKIELPLIGINLYPLFSRKILSRSRHGLRTRMPYSTAEIIDRLAKLYWERYSSPLFISETASEGKLKRRDQWLTDSVEAVKRVRERGIPLVGYTWWPLFALVTWAYRQGRNAPGYYLKQMGLWDLKADEHGAMHRVPTSLVEKYKMLVGSGGARVGELAVTPDQVAQYV